MQKIILASILIVGLMTGSAEDAHAYDLIGAGANSCGAWTSDRRHPDGFGAREDHQWALGFLSGIGFIAESQANPLEDVDAQGVWAWIDNYCGAHPIEKIAEAAAAFYRAHPHR